MEASPRPYSFAVVADRRFQNSVFTQEFYLTRTRGSITRQHGELRRRSRSIATFNHTFCVNVHYQQKASFPSRRIAAYIAPVSHIYVYE